jgi:hypothetical protein
MLRVQERWFAGEAGIDEQQLRLLRALPIFASTPAAPAACAEAGIGAGARTGNEHLDLLEPRFLAPEGADPGLLAGGSFFLPGGPEECCVLTQRLGVQQLDDERFLIDHILPRWALASCP